ncbi:ribonuclease III [Candidatus Dojkabacteria bacterium]|nr:ribonuclease III [Candidatus Dojkabacteria bacterium]
MQKQEEKKLKKLEQSLEIEFKDIKLLKNALIHRSYLNEANQKDELSNNERLEFLGDAVLELIVTEYLFIQYPKRPEGDLTSFRAATVKTETLAQVSRELDLGKYLYISKGEDLTHGRSKPYILANTFEALLGAIYEDQGYEKAKEFVYNKLIPKIKNIVKYRLDIDNKSKLQEISQEILHITPVYKLVKAEGPDHNKTFVMKIVIGERTFEKGTGKSKQEAEQDAAKSALKNWDKIVDEFKTNADKQ